MSVTLILTRHGKSDWDDPALDDHDRPLTERGHRSAAAIGRWLAERATIPGAALVSSARRTLETWSGIAAELPQRVEPGVSDGLYHAGAAKMLAQIRTLAHPVAIVVGHNPGIGELAGRLVQAPPDHPRFAEYPTCATTVIDFEGGWGGITWGEGRATAFTVPRDLD